MKKIIFAVICLLSFSVMLSNISSSNIPLTKNETKEYRESFNSEKNAALAREIGEEIKASEVAVLGDENKILVGISLNQGTKNRSALREKAEEMAKKKYPKTDVTVEVESPKTQEILDLAQDLGEGANVKMLRKRIKKLFNS